MHYSLMPSFAHIGFESMSGMKLAAYGLKL